MSLERMIAAVCRTARDMWEKGWVEANGGNLSWRLDAEDAQAVRVLAPKGGWTPLAGACPQMAGEYFIVTAAGSFIRNIELDPERYTGVVEIDAAGAAWRVLWGFRDGGRPTSEFGAHLGAHSAAKKRSGGEERVFMHAHPTNLCALTFTGDYDSRALTRLLWRMSTECMMVFPGGIEYVPVLVPGGRELAAATTAAIAKRSLVVWKHHGMGATGRSLDEAFGRMHVVDKAAELYLKAMAAAGELRTALSDDDLRAIAADVSCEYDREFLD